MGRSWSWDLRYKNEALASIYGFYCRLRLSMQSSHPHTILSGVFASLGSTRPLPTNIASIAEDLGICKSDFGGERCMHGTHHQLLKEVKETIQLINCMYVLHLRAYNMKCWRFVLFQPVWGLYLVRTFLPNYKLNSDFWVLPGIKNLWNTHKPAC